MSSSKDFEWGERYENQQSTNPPTSYTNGYTSVSYLCRNLKGFKSASFFPAKVRSLISDFAVIIAIVSMVVVDYLVGVPTPKMQVPDTVRPTWEGRQWFIHPFGTEPVPGLQVRHSVLPS